MYAYIDETGNTGSNIFDENQPDFYTGALICRVNFDLQLQKVFQRIAGKVDAQGLHANELGLGKIDLIAPDVLEVFKKKKARFFISRVEKNYLLIFKIFDTLFDSFENKAVAWHVYNLKPLRILLVHKLAYVTPIDDGKLFWFWSALMERNRDKAYRKIKEFFKEFKKNVKFIPDQRSREVVNEALDWASRNPEAIYLHSNSKALRLGHLPNVAIFPAVLGGIEQKAKLWGIPVKEIVHDRQSQFERTLAEMHKLFSCAEPGTHLFNLPFSEKISVRRVANSNFIIKKSQDSPGIQAIDLVLWLYKRVINKNELTYNCKKLLLYILRNGHRDDLSFEAAEVYLEEAIGKIESAPFGLKEQGVAKEMMEKFEQNRQDKMLEYSKQKNGVA